MWRMLLMVVAILADLAVFGQDRPARVQVHGRVIVAGTGQVVYATVEHYDLEGKRWSLTEVNSDGRFALFLPCDVPFELRVTENGFVPLTEQHPAVPCGTATFEADLELTPSMR
ncbi:MAG: hypothetical protein H6595_09175 [Flavobacteriales bacterium]|nr:hypothetical protein [Flavobacteriales bacterium]MCB9167639.1 hypothetical protein [Flavobacteriales bacterium]